MNIDVQYDTEQLSVLYCYNHIVHSAIEINFLSVWAASKQDILQHRSTPPGTAVPWIWYSCEQTAQKYLQPFFSRCCYVGGSVKN